MTEPAKQPAADAFARYPSLAGRTVFITGGATGIGAELVAQFARQGARVGFVDVQERAAADLALELEALTGTRLEHWITPAAEAEIERNQCLPGRVEPADVARLALWLAADDSRMCTSQTWVVDGGWT